MSLPPELHMTGCLPSFRSLIKSHFPHYPVCSSPFFWVNCLFALFWFSSLHLAHVRLLCLCSVSSVQSLSLSDSLRPHRLQHARPPCPSPTPRVYSNPCPLSQWYHPTISSSVSSCLQSFPASGSFPVGQFFKSGGQSIGVSASASMNIQDWFPLGWTG